MYTCIHMNIYTYVYIVAVSCQLLAMECTHVRRVRWALLVTQIYTFTNGWVYMYTCAVNQLLDMKYTHVLRGRDLSRHTYMCIHECTCIYLHVCTHMYI